MFRATPGQLPAADARDLAGIALPPGCIVTAQEGAGAPVAWVSIERLSEDHLTELVRGLAAVFPRTGLWPMQALGLDNGLDRPWGDGEMDGPEGSGRDVSEYIRGNGQCLVARVDRRVIGCDGERNCGLLRLDR